MGCDELDDLIEGFAEGELPAPAADAHLRTCARCRSRLALAEATARLLAAREVPAPPEHFTEQVMRRVRQERWRVEQVVDAGFNVALAAGVLVIAAGAAGLLWSLGVLSFDVSALSSTLITVAPWTTRVAAEAQTMIVALVLLSSALTLWWWVEGETGETG